MTVLHGYEYRTIHEKIEPLKYAEMNSTIRARKCRLKKKVDVIKGIWGEDKAREYFGIKI